MTEFTIDKMRYEIFYEDDCYFFENREDAIKAFASSSVEHD